MHWERIETVAESFGDLDPMMDAREADLEPGQEWTGWHRIEKDLWPAAGGGLHAAHRRGAARRTPTTCWPTPRPRTRGCRTLTYTVDQIANGSRGLLEEVATGKVTGEEEYWSRTDLWDFQANVDGARVAFEGVQPIVEQKDPELAEELDARFEELQALLDAQRVGDGFKYLRRADARTRSRQLSDAVNALSEPLSQAHRGGARACMTESCPPTTSRAARLPRRRRGRRRGGGRVRGRPVERGPRPRRAGRAGPRRTPFRGEHQAGIVTPAQDRLHFAAFDVTTDDRDELIDLLQQWTEAAERMTAGEPAGPVGPVEGAAPTCRPTTPARRSGCRRAG